MKKRIPLALSLASFLMVVGCSNTSSLPETATTSITGTAMDGVIHDAKVCIDVNDNNKCDTNEPTTQTDVFGKFTLDSTGVNGKLLVSGGTDMGTGLAFSGTLKAPAGSTVVTPLTSAVQSLVESGKTAKEAEATIKTALNLPEHLELTSYDPFEEIGDDENNDTSKESAQQVLAATAHLQTIVHSVSATVAGADANVSIADAMGDAMDSIAESLQTAVTLSEATGEKVELDTEIVVKATKDAANAIYAENPAALVSVKSVAESVAVTTIAAANDTKQAVEEADIADSESVNLAFNTGMIVTNDALASRLNDKAEKAAEEASKLDEKEITEIATAQKAQEDAEEEIVEKELASAKAVVEAKEKAEAASKEDASQEDIVAALEASQELAKLQKAQAEAEKKAAEAAKAAAEYEAKVAAEEAAAKQAAAEAAAAAAATEARLAELEEAAKKKAAEEAEAAENAAKAKAAAEAAAKAEAEAIAQKIADECTEKGGTMQDDQCVLPSVTGAVSAL